MQEYSIFGILISWLKCSRGCFVFCRQVFSLASCQRVIQSSFYFLSLFICCSIFFVSSIKVSAGTTAAECSTLYQQLEQNIVEYNKSAFDERRKILIDYHAQIVNKKCKSWPKDYYCDDINQDPDIVGRLKHCVEKAENSLTTDAQRQPDAVSDLSQSKKLEKNKQEKTKGATDEDASSSQKGTLVSTCESIRNRINPLCENTIEECKVIDILNIANIGGSNDNKDYIKMTYEYLRLNTCHGEVKKSLKDQFVPICKEHLSKITKDKLPLFCPGGDKKNDSKNNKDHCEKYCETQFDNFYMSKYSMEDRLEKYSKEQFATDYLKDFPAKPEGPSYTCEGSPNKEECGSFSIAYLALIRGKVWEKNNILGMKPSDSYEAPLEDTIALGKWLNKKLFGSTSPEKPILTEDAEEEGFHWLEKCDIDKENPTDCQKEIKAALAKAGEVCTEEIEKVVSCCASPITCASGETSVPSLTTAFGLIYALQDVAAQIHVTSGPIGEDVYEYQREVCQRMKQANIGKAGISGAMAAMCKAASVSCQSGCTDTTDEAFAVLDKHCAYEGGKQRMEALKKGQHIDFDKLFICTQDFFETYKKEYRALKKATAECSKASAIGIAHLQQMGVSGAQALMLEQAGCGVRPKDPECTGNQLQDKLNKRNDCSLDCKKYPYQSACSCDEPPYHDECTTCQKNPEHEDCRKTFCTEHPQHVDCIDCSLDENRDSASCVSGGGGADCTEAANKDHPDCQKDLSRGDGEFPENEEEDLISANPQGEGNPAPGGLMAGASGSGSGGLKGLGGSGGGPAGGGKKRRGKRKVQSILQGFKGRGQFGGYGFSGGGGGDPEKEGKGKKAKNKMTVDLGKYFKKKGRLGSGAHKNIFQRISKRFKWMCKQRKIECI